MSDVTLLEAFVIIIFDVDQTFPVLLQLFWQLNG